MNAETWKPVGGWEGWYEVSDLGRVRGTDRTTIRKDGSTQTWRGRTLTPCPSPKGYLVVTLSRPGARLSARVARLVAFAFLPPGHTTETVNHIDGRKPNNAATNLEWATRTENTQHAIENGLGTFIPPLTRRGERRNTKLMPVMLADCQRRIERGESIRSLAREHGIDNGTMREALGRRKRKNPPRRMPTPPSGEGGS